jgi:hypothetical protein
MARRFPWGETRDADLERLTRRSSDVHLTDHRQVGKTYDLALDSSLTVWAYTNVMHVFGKQQTNPVEISRMPFAHLSAPNETVEKGQLLIFSQSAVVENQWLMNPCFW